jgi:hypothetical protein
MFKLSGWVWLVAGIFIGLAIVSYGFFQFYVPDATEAEMINRYADNLQIEADKIPATERRIENAVARVEEMADIWRETSTRKSANGSGFIDLTQNPLALTVNAPAYRDKVQTAVNRQVKVGGVTVISGPFVQRPSNDAQSLLNNYFNYSRLPFPVVLFELGTVTIQGTFAQISRNVQAWSEMPDYFAVVDGLAITGTSPELTATYNVTIVGFPPGGASGPLAAPVITGASQPGIQGR